MAKGEPADVRADRIGQELTKDLFPDAPISVWAAEVLVRRAVRQVLRELENEAKDHE